MSVKPDSRILYIVSSSYWYLYITEHELPALAAPRACKPPMADGAAPRLSAELEEERERVRELKKLLRQERKQVRPPEMSPRRISA